MNDFKSTISDNIIDQGTNSDAFMSSKSMCRPPPSEDNNTRPFRRFATRIVQNFLLLWLDGNIDEINNYDCRNTISKLRQIVNTIYTFTDIDECIAFIKEIKDEYIFIISSGSFGETVVPKIHDMAQISTIYIFCQNKPKHKQWAKNWSKIKDVSTEITEICEALRNAGIDCDRNTISISYLNMSGDVINQNLDKFDQCFIYSHILKEILLTIDFEREHIDEFISYCREQYLGNTAKLKNVDQLEKEYCDHTPIWWYTHQYFLSSMLNKALRTMEGELIIKLGFFICHLHEHIAKLHSEQYTNQAELSSFTIYRGQGLRQTDFDQLMKMKGELLSFNNFFSATKNRQYSSNSACHAMTNSDLVGVLFVMTMDPSISSTCFADVREVTFYQPDEEILVSMHCVFRIGEIKEIDRDNRLWEVDLTLISENDPQWSALTERIREETFSNCKGWNRLGKLLIKLREFNKAEQLYDVLLDQTCDDYEKVQCYHMLGMINDSQRKYEEAIKYYEKSIEVGEQILPQNHPDLVLTYSSIGSSHYKMGEHLKALTFHEKVLAIRKETLPPNDPSLAESYKTIARLHCKMGEYSKALLYYNQTIEIQEKNLPENHPDLANIYSDIGLIYDNMGEYSKALSYHEKVLTIRKEFLPEDHLDLASCYKNIGSVYCNKGDYSKALSYYQKDLEISLKHLQPNDPNLATSYNDIGLIYDNMDEPSKAFLCHVKALEIYKNTLLSNHLYLATSYDNIGSACTNMGDYSEALSYHEKALEIREKVCTSNHPDLATSYNNIGLVYNDMGNYTAAFSFFERAVNIGQHCFSESNPSLKLWKNNLESVKKRL